MAFTHIRTVEPSVSEVVICSDHHPDECVVVGLVRQDVVRRTWTIEPANAQVTDEVYATEEAAIHALLESEYAYVTHIPTENLESPTPVVQKTLAFLRELLTETDDCTT